ncbi:MAG: hypothetical protein LBV17_08990 [Treponema sp.]|nr:hypothetical protein [Treponema sp.]
MEYDDKSILLIRSFQEKILLFLSIAGYASWHILKRNINNLIDTEPENKIVLGENSEYSVLYPLLRNGFIETARNPESGKLVYCLGLNVIIQTLDDKFFKITPENCSCELVDKNNIGTLPIISNDASLFLLKRISSLEDILLHWSTSNIKMNYIYDRFNKNHFRRINETATKSNIYTNSNQFYSEKYLKTRKGGLYLIPSIEDNIDAINIALCYLKEINKQPIFYYSSKKKRITTEDFNSIIPIIICRALLLCDFTNYNKILYNRKSMINNISIEHITELKRIFGENAVREDYE